MLKHPWPDIAALLAKGATAREAAAPYELSPETVRHKRQQNAEFRALVDELRLRAVQEAAAALDHEARDAVRTLAELSRTSVVDGVRVRAAVALLSSLTSVGESAALRQGLADAQAKLDALTNPQPAEPTGDSDADKG